MIYLFYKYKYSLDSVFKTTVSRDRNMDYVTCG